MNILITGTAGFIGFHLAKTLLKNGHSVWGIDNINDYYDVNLKYARLEDAGIKREKVEWNTWVKSETNENYSFIRSDISVKKDLEKIFDVAKFDQVINLAAQAGVRYSLENPSAYVEANLVGFVNILEGCRHRGIKKLVYASSSSVYGMNKEVPFSEDHVVDHPISLYAATKKSNELMAYTYTHLFGIQTVGLRFFTVYGPWGRPDMAPMLFANAAKNGDTIKVFNNGDQSRDFTYIDDIVQGIQKVSEIEVDKPHQVLNIGNGSPVGLMDFISVIEKSYGVELDKNYMPAQPGDVTQTYASTKQIENTYGYKSTTSIEEGIGQFIKWFKEYYNA